MGILDKGNGQRRSAYYVNVNIIKVIPGFNRRSSRLKKAELKGQILAAGRVNMAITGYYKDDAFYPVSGHGRVECVQELLAEGKDVDPMIPAEFVKEPKTPEDEAILVARQVTDNSGENLRPIDSARVINDLIKQFGWSKSKIATFMGMSDSWVGQTLKVLELPLPLQQSIENDDISVTLASEIMMANPNPDIATEIINRTIQTAKANGKPRATQKDLDEVLGNKPTTTRVPRAQRKTPNPKTPQPSPVENFIKAATVTEITENRVSLVVSVEVWQAFLDSQKH